MSYLDLIDGILRGGVHALGGSFAELQRGWLECRQQPDGGFAGRRSGSDPYYTDFALRGLDLLITDSPIFESAARHLRDSAREPTDLIEVFSLLSCARTLRRHGVSFIAHQRAGRRLLDDRILPDGGFCNAGGEQLSAYHSFLGTLCLQMLGEASGLQDTSRAVGGLQRDSGGFAERETEHTAQTNATCAAIALLLMGDAFEPARGERAARFLVDMQSANGGIRAHPTAAGGDLLSSFTGLLTLCLLGAQHQLDLPALARFIRGAARPGGGFSSGPVDAAADVEYTYYGIASLGLMRSLLEDAD